jgi:hypothetical protein
VVLWTLRNAQSIGADGGRPGARRVRDRARDGTPRLKRKSQLKSAVVLNAWRAPSSRSTRMHCRRLMCSDSLNPRNVRGARPLGLYLSDAPLSSSRPSKDMNADALTAHNRPVRACRTMTASQAVDSVHADGVSGSPRVVASHIWNWRDGLLDNFTRRHRRHRERVPGASTMSPQIRWIPGQSRGTAGNR